MSRLARLALIGLMAVVVAGVAGYIVHRGERDEGERAACVKEPDRDAKAPAYREEKDRDAEESRAAGGMYSGPKAIEPPCGDKPGLPESFADLARANSSIAARSTAPGTEIRNGAYRSAIRAAGDLTQTDGDWQPYGNSPLETGRTQYDTTNGSTSEGLGNVAGRMTAFTRDPASGRLFATGSNAGVWTSTDGGGTWTSIGDNLPTQVASGIAYLDGTLVVLTGDNAFGGSTFAGLGVYRSTDLGATWQHSSGIPDGILGFKLAVDPIHAGTLYAATGAGLFKSTDDGATFTDVRLPVGPCAMQATTAKDCFLAKMVTDIVVQGPANAQSTGGHPGAVLAAVGWRGGSSATNKDGASQSPGNGIYESDSGDPGTFHDVQIQSNNTPQAGGDAITKSTLGRMALGVANGPNQNHQIVYALIQDANKFNGHPGGIDAGEGVPASDYLNGVWVSTNFGQSWKELDGSNHIDNDPTSGSALAPPVCKAPAVVSYCPGVQAWYNLWVEPDPTRATATGVPTRYAFGLEEVWSNDPASTPPTGLDGSLPVKSKVIGRYFAGATCTLLNATNGLPVCPASSSGTTPATTTHPDQHGALWLPDGSGGVTLFAANDGGVYKQHAASGADLTNDGWGKGSNIGLHTTQPYDIGIAKDGTAYMGLQDNGEQKIEPDGTTYTVYGGDGFFTAVDPNDANTAFEEYTNGVMSVTKDGGKTWTTITPDNLTSALFSTPFEMDANDAKHLVIGGRDIEETGAGPDTTSSSWQKVYDLGTRAHRGDASATAAADDPDNQVSAVDTKSINAATGAPTGPHTPDFAYTGGQGTIPGGQEDPSGALPAGTFPPGTYTDHAFTVGPNDGDASLSVTLSWASSNDDWDLYVYRKNADGSLTEAGSSAQGMTTSETVGVTNPAPGDYIVRAVNFTATGTFNAKATFTQRTPANTSVTATYIGFCGFCDTITQGTPFGDGIATNVGGDKPGKIGAPDGWHIAKAAGLPSRYITSIRIDPADPRTVYVTLAGYGRRWAFPGAVGEDTSAIGTGHVFKSTDAGETFTNVSGNLPDVPANWSVLKDGRLIVGTDIGVFLSSGTDGGDYARLGRGLPTVPVSSLRFKPGDPDLLFVATFGRGAYTYRFAKRTPPPAQTQTQSATQPVACSAARGFKSVKVTRVRGGLRFSVARAVRAKFTIDVFRESAGRRVLTERRVAHFPGRSKSFTWKTGRKVGDGYYFVRATMKAGGASDARRIALRRVKKRFTARPAYFEQRRCRVIRLARLNRPVFAGRTRASLVISSALTRAGSITVEVKRGTKRVLRKTFAKPGTATRKVTLKAKGTKPGDYVITVTGKAGKTTEKVKLTGRRV